MKDNLKLLDESKSTNKVYRYVVIHGVSRLACSNQVFISCKCRANWELLPTAADEVEATSGGGKDGSEPRPHRPMVFCHAPLYLRLIHLNIANQYQQVIIHIHCFTGN